MTKIAHVYERNGQWYYQPSSMTTNGLWIVTPLLIQVGGYDSPRKKGEAALEVLLASHQGVPLPEDTSSVALPLLNKVGAESWAEFAKTAKCLGLELEDGVVTLIPHRPRPRSKGSWQGMSEQQIVLPADASPEELGAALEEAMSRCK